MLPAALGRRVAGAGAVLSFTGELLLFVAAAVALIAVGAAAVVLRPSGLRSIR